MTLESKTSKIFKNEIIIFVRIEGFTTEKKMKWFLFPQIPKTFSLLKIIPKNKINLQMLILRPDNKFAKNYIDFLKTWHYILQYKWYRENKHGQKGPLADMCMQAQTQILININILCIQLDEVGIHRCFYFRWHHAGRARRRWRLNWLRVGQGEWQLNWKIP